MRHSTPGGLILHNLAQTSDVLPTLERSDSENRMVSPSLLRFLSPTRGTKWA